MYCSGLLSIIFMTWSLKKFLYFLEIENHPILQIGFNNIFLIMI